MWIVIDGDIGARTRCSVDATDSIRNIAVVQIVYPLTTSGSCFQIHWIIDRVRAICVPWIGVGKDGIFETLIAASGWSGTSIDCFGDVSGRGCCLFRSLSIDDADSSHRSLRNDSVRVRDGYSRFRIVKTLADATDLALRQLEIHDDGWSWCRCCSISFGQRIAGDGFLGRKRTGRHPDGPMQCQRGY